MKTSTVKQRIFNKILSALRTTTIFVGKDKVAYNLQAIIYLAKTEILVNSKFRNGKLQVNWRSLHRFIPDTAYWQLREMPIQGFPEIGDETEVNYEPFGPKSIPTGVHFDGTLFTEDEINEIMGCLWELRAYLLLINEKAWEIIVKHVNPSGMCDMYDTFPAAAAIQFMMTEIHMTSQLGITEILSRANAAFSKIVADYPTAETMVRDYQTFKELLEQNTTGSVQTPGQMLLTKMVECMQLTSQVEKIPQHCNPQRVAMMIAGVGDLAKVHYEHPQCSFAKQLRAWFRTFVLEFQHTKERQSAVGILASFTSGTSQTVPFTPAQANAAAVTQQGKPLADSTNVQRGQNEGYNGKGKKDKKRKFNQGSGNNHGQPGSIIEHKGASHGYGQGSNHTVGCAIVEGTTPPKYAVSKEGIPRAVDYVDPVLNKAPAEGHLKADIHPTLSISDADYEEYLAQVRNNKGR